MGSFHYTNRGRYEPRNDIPFLCSKHWYRRHCNGRYHRYHPQLGYISLNQRLNDNTQRDISFKIIAVGSIVVLLLTFIFFLTGVMHGNLLFAVVGILLVTVIAFLFTTVAANAIAIVGSNPVSGMTLMTLILASVVMVFVGLKGYAGMLAALIMGGVEQHHENKKVGSSWAR